MTYCDLLERGARCIEITTVILRAEGFEELAAEQLDPEVTLRHAHSPISVVDIEYEGNVSITLYLSRVSHLPDFEKESVFHAVLCWNDHFSGKAKRKSYDWQMIEAMRLVAQKNSSELPASEAPLSDLLFDVAVETGLMPF